MTRVIPVDEVVATLRARADELDAKFLAHRCNCGRGEGNRTRDKWAAQARELRRVADVFATYDELSVGLGSAT